MYYVLFGICCYQYLDLCRRYIVDHILATGSSVVSSIQSSAKMNLRLQSLILFWASTSSLCILHVQSFTVSSHIRSSSALPTRTSLDSITSTARSTEELKDQLESEIQSTSRGLSASSDQQKKIDSLVRELELKCPLKEPARSSLMEGKWIVEYTTAPPPSNGKLGPFVGIARQIIDLDQGTYTNYLSVPGEIEKEWLSARLEATYVEWNGDLLDDARVISSDVQDRTDPLKVDDVVPSKQGDNWLEALTSIFQGKESFTGNISEPDYGADSWKVDFQTLTIKVFGFQVVQMKFDEGTSRVWKMSYLDDEGTRIGEQCTMDFLCFSHIYTYASFIILTLCTYKMTYNKR